jgi:hypothetical protein
MKPWLKGIRGKEFKGQEKKGSRLGLEMWKMAERQVQ